MKKTFSLCFLVFITFLFISCSASTTSTALDDSNSYSFVETDEDITITLYDFSIEEIRDTAESMYFHCVVLKAKIMNNSNETKVFSVGIYDKFTVKKDGESAGCCLFGYSEFSFGIITTETAFIDANSYIIGDVIIPFTVNKYIESGVYEITYHGNTFFVDVQENSAYYIGTELPDE